MARECRRGRSQAACVVCFLLLAASQADAAAGASSGAGGVGLTGSSEGIFVLELVLLLVVGRGLGELFQRLDQPAIMGQLIGGILLGPTLFGWLWPTLQHSVFPSDPAQKGMIEAVAQLGILLLLMLTGMETDLKLVRRVGASCLSISTTGIIVPFVCGFAFSFFLPESLLPNPSQRLVAGIFLGTALSISSVKIVAMVVREMNFMRRNLGQIIVSSAIIEDTIGWLIIAVTFGIVSHGKVELLPLLGTVAAVAAFMIFSFTIGRRMVFSLIRWSNDTLQSEYAVITVILVIMGTMAWVTNLIGVHTVLGAFVAGILIGESPILSRHIEAQLRGIITALFMPVFFGMAGLSANLTVLADPHLALLTAALIAIASVGKFSGAFLGGRAAGMSWKEATAVGCAMNARGSTEVIVASIGLSVNILSDTLFTMIVTMAVCTTLSMPPMLRWALRRLPMSPEEKERVEREALDERGFVARLERLLVIVDDSAVGKFAARLAGMVGGCSGMPITLLRQNTELSASLPEGGRPREHVRQLRRAAKSSADAVQQDEGTPVEEVHLTARNEIPVTTETVADESRKGYDLLFVGLGGSTGGNGAFAPRLNDIAAGFDGALCLVLPGEVDARPMPRLGKGSTILVPINGTEVARRAADLALALARPRKAHVKVLYVVREKRLGRRPSISRWREEAMLKEIVELADRYDVPVRTAIRTHTSPGDAICKEARQAALVVMGATQRPGPDLFFGPTAMSVVANCPQPIVLVASERGLRTG
ncbi:Kef-type K+ transport system membrane component KefB [Mesorhizobium soli]|uniref:cation:proton antiporter domain-containing protein n=1 Tax=Pseudaminobacter soli (ex Li et al. 2025) TaxID=1295366 RepID=UPI00247C4BFD|nr:Kef-type K+ transport system membrane component KefB [Mesorhizobium soli]